MPNRKVNTHHTRKESLPEILAWMKEILEGTDPKKAIYYTQVFVTGYFEAILVIEA